LGDSNKPLLEESEKAPLVDYSQPEPEPEPELAQASAEYQSDSELLDSRKKTETEEMETPPAPGDNIEDAYIQKGAIWQDSLGKELGVGSEVSFLMKKSGQTIAVEGTLLGEKDGKALIEVGPGSPLPKNDYQIPWSIVRAI